jgi:TatA/E family protein of Tat protein translocase
MGIDNPVHLAFIAIVALVVLGPKRLPELARALGHGIREFRQAVSMEVSPEAPPAPEVLPPAPEVLPPAPEVLPPAPEVLPPAPVPAAHVPLTSEAPAPAALPGSESQAPAED